MSMFRKAMAGLGQGLQDAALLRAQHEMSVARDARLAQMQNEFAMKRDASQHQNTLELDKIRGGREGEQLDRRIGSTEKLHGETIAANKEAADLKYQRDLDLAKITAGSKSAETTKKNNEAFAADVAKAANRALTKKGQFGEEVVKRNSELIVAESSRFAKGLAVGGFTDRAPADYVGSMFAHYMNKSVQTVDQLMLDNDGMTRQQAEEIQDSQVAQAIKDAKTHIKEVIGLTQQTPPPDAIAFVQQNANEVGGANGETYKQLFMEKYGIKSDKDFEKVIGGVAPPATAAPSAAQPSQETSAVDRPRVSVGRVQLGTSGDIGA